MSKEEEKFKIIWIDGIPCMELPPNTIMKKGQRKSVEVKNPFRFGKLQEQRKREFMPDMIRELDKIFNSELNTPFFPASWKIYQINQLGEIKELKDEDEENDNAK